MQPKYNDLLLITVSHNQQLFGLQQKKKCIYSEKYIHPFLILDPRLYTKPAEVICNEMIIYIALEHSTLVTHRNIQIQVSTKEFQQILTNTFYLLR